MHRFGLQKRQKYDIITDVEFYLFNMTEINKGDMAVSAKDKEMQVLGEGKPEKKKKGHSAAGIEVRNALLKAGLEAERDKRVIKDKARAPARAEARAKFEAEARAKADEERVKVMGGMDKRDAKFLAAAKKEKEIQSELDKTLAAYEKAESATDFANYVLENSDIVLTKEKAQSNPAINEYFKNNFKGEESGLRYQDLIDALPMEGDYVEKAGRENVKKEAKPAKKRASKEKDAEALKGVRGKIAGEKVVIDEEYAREVGMIPPEKSKLDEDAEPYLDYQISNYQKEKPQVDAKRLKEVAAEEAQRRYVRAYREYDPSFTTNKADDLIAITRPPFLAFGAGARELKNLYKKMAQAREDAASEASLEPQTREALSSMAKQNVGKEALAPQSAREALKRAAKEDEESIAPGNRKISPAAEEFVEQPSEEVQEQEAEENQEEQINQKKEFTSPLIERLKGMSIKEGLDSVLKERASGIEKRLGEISEYFSDKYKMSGEAAHKFLMGNEIKGWFKGKQIQMQQEYKNLFTSSVYKDWLKAKKNK